jgi:hypothetical protein
MSHRYFINKWYASNYQIDLEGVGLCGKVYITVKPVFSCDSIKYQLTITAPNCKPESWFFDYSYTVLEVLRDNWKVKYCKPNLMEDLLSLIEFN